MVSSKNKTVVLRMIYKSTLNVPTTPAACGGTGSSVKISENWSHPIPSMGLGRQTTTRESIPTDSAINPQVTNQYRCRLVRRSSCPSSHVVDGSVLIVAVRQYIVVSGSVFAPRPLLVVGGPSVRCCFLGAELPNQPRMCVQSGGFLSCLRRV